MVGYSFQMENWGEHIRFVPLIARVLTFVTVTSLLWADQDLMALRASILSPCFPFRTHALNHRCAGECVRTCMCACPSSSLSYHFVILSLHNQSPKPRPQVLAALAVFLLILPLTWLPPVNR